MNERLLTYISVFIAIVMIVSGIAVMETPEAIYVSALAGLLRFTESGVQIEQLGAALVVVGVSALLAHLPSLTLPTRLLFLIPQQIILVVQIWSIGHTIMTGQYPDGYRPGGHECFLLGNVGSCFILADQWVMFSLALVHTYELGRAIIFPERYLEFE